MNKPLWHAFHHFSQKIYAMITRASTSPENVFEQIARMWPIYRKMRQQDSHEFLRLFLEALDEEQLSYKNKLPRKAKPSQSDEANDSAEGPKESRKPRLLESIFGGKILSSVKCSHCGHVSEIEEPFMDLSLAVSIPSTSPLVSQKDGNMLTQLKNRWLPNFLNYSSTPLETLLENFVQRDTLNGHPCYECEKCSKVYLDDASPRLTVEEQLEENRREEHEACQNTAILKKDKDGRPYRIAYRMAEKWERIMAFPEILVIHLNRFMSTGYRGKFSKNSSYVAYPEFLPMSRYSSDYSEDAPPLQDVMYQLYATVVHCGSSSDSGHYIAMVKATNTEDRTCCWYRCSDSSVLSATREEVFCGDAYILFYMKML
jgi:ubiquitin C-terminal hydrolase